MNKIWILLFLSSIGYGQKFINFEVAQSGQIELSKGILIDKVHAGYSLWLPVAKPKGAIVFFHSERDSLNINSISKLANKRNLTALFVTTENRFEFFFEVKKMRETELYIHQACQENAIPI